MGANTRSAGRFALVTLLIGVVLGLVAPRLAAGPPSSSGRPLVHVVGSGETLWELAERYAPGRDPRRFVYEARRLNELETGPIRPGQRLVLPRI